jgi:hypothetical protein
MLEDCPDLGKGDVYTFPCKTPCELVGLQFNSLDQFYENRNNPFRLR